MKDNVLLSVLSCEFIMLCKAGQSFIHSFISGMHHYECLVPNVDISLQSGWFWATSVASFRERFIDFRSCWVVFIHVVRGRPGGLLQFSKGEAVKICLASDSSGIRAIWPNRERHRAWTVAERCSCSVFCLTSSFRTWIWKQPCYNLFIIWLNLSK